MTTRLVTTNRLDDLPDLSTRDEIALLFGVSVPTLARWAADGTGPRVTRLGRHVRYARADVLAYLDDAKTAA